MDESRPDPAQSDRIVLDLDRFLPYRLSVLSNRISSEIAALYEARFGVSVTEWRVMAVLGRYPQVSAMEVAEHTAMDKVAVSRTVNALIERGLLQRDIHSDDRRRSVLALSEAGFAIYDQIVPLALGYERQLLDSLSQTDIKRFDALLETLLHR
ncbi:MAG: MarR family winged helix-turn-helix transcriptional regulator [Pseudomarimonas sp.]